MTQPLGETFEAAKKGSQDAWNRLVDRYHPLVMSVAQRYRLSADDAAEVNQTVWLRLVEHLGQMQEARALPGWIVTTTKREALRLLRERSRPRSVDPWPGPGRDGACEPDLDEDPLRAERQQALREGLAELRPSHRQLILLLLTEPALSYDEISQRLDVPKGSIGPTRARCLAELRRTSAFRSFIAKHETDWGDDPPGLSVRV